ncbi:FKBP-type peptidyl-prolyl cis-trans isomerase [Odoribacter sp. OttesenSCG-928-L07]|nr:FKBP-type peptidyl-prolyl cis-trans isomerase [Odoribacter sp. OttesenSCG-928-L07]MDL2239974.1 FKBP-type peptidyl-prolyl cis-trans isomerase [Bacteroidales bacterium OttesenSCG-928-L14]
MIDYKYLVLAFVLLFSLSSCSNKKNKQIPEQQIISKEAIEYANKEAIRKENIQIDDFVRRYKWDMQTTNTGVRYFIYEKGRGVKTKKNDIVVLDYTLTFLNGDTIYSSENDGIKEFVLGKSNEVSGLEEVLLLMHKGDKAKLIVPSFRAYGITGDFNKISVRNTLVYDIHLQDVY